LIASTGSAREAVTFAQKAGDKWEEGCSAAAQAWALYLHGDTKTAETVFVQTEILFRQDNSNKNFLYSYPGILQANHLRRIGRSDYARRVTEANLQTCERNHWAKSISQCHRVLGDLDSDSGNHASARTHYDTALKIARGISARYVLIEALLARGRWAAKYMKDATSAFNDLNEALGYAVEGGYRIYEADIRVALAWAGQRAVSSQ